MNGVDSGCSLSEEPAAGSSIADCDDFNMDLMQHGLMFLRHVMDIPEEEGTMNIHFSDATEYNESFNAAACTSYGGAVTVEE